MTLCLAFSLYSFIIDIRVAWEVNVGYTSIALVIVNCGRKSFVSLTFSGSESFRKGLNVLIKTCLGWPPLQSYRSQHNHVHLHTQFSPQAPNWRTSTAKYIVNERATTPKNCFQFNLLKLSRIVATNYKSSLIFIIVVMCYIVLVQ